MSRQLMQKKTKSKNTVQSTQSNHKWDDKTAHWYVKNYGDWPTTFRVAELIDWHENDRLVDIGCGNGRTLRAIERHVPKGYLYGIDPTQAMLDIAESQTHSARIQYLLGSAESIPLDANCIDKAIAVNSFHHWRNIHKGLKEVRRILKPDGRLFLAEDAEVMEMSGMSIDDYLEQLSAAKFSIQRHQIFHFDTVEFCLIESS